MKEKCVHDRLYVECGECRADAVRKGFEYAESPQGLLENFEHMRVVRLGRCIDQALDLIEHANAHVKAGTKVSPAAALAIEDVCSRLHNLEHTITNESMTMLRGQIERQVRESLPPDAPGNYVAQKAD